MTNLSTLISKFDKTTISGLSIQDQMAVFNCLKELEMYRKIGTLNELMSQNTHHINIDKKG